MPDNKDRVLDVPRVDEENGATKDAEVPKNDRDDTLAFPLRGNPLRHKPHEKTGLTEKPDDDPKIPRKEGHGDVQYRLPEANLQGILLPVMSRNPHISVVIPAHNEAENILPLYEELCRALSALRKTYEIIFIDDGSTDATFDRLAALAASDGSVRVIRFRRNFGQTAAMDAGFKHARGSVIVTLDADLQNDPDDIEMLVQKLEQGFDVVSGWRKERRDPLSKRAISAGANLLRKIVLRDIIHDSGCTLKAYRREAVEHLSLYGEMHRFIPALVEARGFRVGEAVVRHRLRRFGTTKYRFSRVIKGFMDMLVIKFWMQYGTRPAHLFGGIGMGVGALGFIIALILSAEKLFLGASLSNRPLLLLSALLILFGTQLVIFGLLADIMVKVYYDSKERDAYSIERILN